MSETTIVYPAVLGDIVGLAQELLALADDPHHIVWRPKAGGFEVPENVAEAYVYSVAVTAEAAAEKEAEPAEVETATDPAEADDSKTPVGNEPSNLQQDEPKKPVSSAAKRTPKAKAETVKEADNG